MYSNEIEMGGLRDESGLQTADVVPDIQQDGEHFGVGAARPFRFSVFDRVGV
jgi:hypothetical protein